MINRTTTIGFALAISVVLLSCGGGGAGGGSDNGYAPPPGASLAPPSPAPLGTTLADTAASLRPLNNGAQWYYRETKFTATGTVQSADNTFAKATSNGDGSFTEKDSDASTALVSVRNGVVQSTSPNPFDSSLAPIQFTELRSPVRVNDQYLQWHSTNVNIGDVDGDGKADYGEVLIYTTVIGIEQVNLPELSRTLAAVRTDTIMTVSPTVLSTGITLSSLSAIQSTWYASGVGVIRRQGSAPSASGKGPILFDQLLYAWNGVTDGLGIIEPWTPRLSTPGSVAGSTQVLPVAYSAVRIGTNALLISQHGDWAALTATVITGNGDMLRSAKLADLGDFSGNCYYFSSLSNCWLFGLDDNRGLLVTSGVYINGGTGGGKVLAQIIDDTPAKVGAVVAIDWPAYATKTTAHWDGYRLWLMWSEFHGGLTVQLMRQPFGLDGKPLGPPELLDTSPHAFQWKAAAFDGATLWVWGANDVGGRATVRYARSSGIGPLTETFTLGSLSATTSGTPIPNPVISSGVAGLIWSGPIFSISDHAPLPEKDLRGIVFDRNLQPIRSNDTGSLDDEKLPSNWLSTRDYPPLVVAAGNSIVSASVATAQSISGLAGTRDINYVNVATPGTNTLKSSATTAQSFVARSPPDGSMRPQQILMWPDHLLVLGESLGSFHWGEVSLVWLK